MKNQSVRLALSSLGVSLSVFAGIPSLAMGATAARKCEGFFAPSAEPESSATVKSKRSDAPAQAAQVARVDPRSSIVVRTNEPTADRRDLTMLGDDPISRAGVPAIPNSYVKHLVVTKTSEGDFIEAQIYTQGSPYTPKAPAQGALAAQSKPTAVGYSGSNGAVANVGRALAPRSNTHAVVSESESRRLVRELITEKDAVDIRLDASQINMMVDMLHKDKSTLARAMDYAAEKKERGANFIADAPNLTMSNVGLGRYFRFRPKTIGAEVDARVLDLNPKRQSGVMNILVEWMEPARDDSPRVRRISSLTVEELATARLMDDIGRKEVAANFEDLLSINEVKTRRFANLLGLKTFGISQYDPNGRSFETRGGRVDMFLDPYSAVTGNSPSMSRSRFESRFGSVADLLTAAELQDHRVNMFDVTSRLNPGFVLKRLAADQSFAKFAFVITEDGQLKIAAHLPDHISENPDFLRLGHGRRIFAKGLFELGRDGTVRVSSSRAPREIIGYGDNPARNEEASARLIAAAFASQAGRRLIEFDGVFLQGDALAGFTDVSSQRGQWSSTDFYDSAWGAFTGRPDSYVPPFSGRASTARSTSATSQNAGTHLAWDSSTNAKPLSYEPWQAEMRKVLGRELNLHDAGETKVGWAHYVLKSNANMSKDDIRKNYRKLASRFHSDTHGNGETVEDRADFQNVNTAWQTVEAVFASGAK